MPLTYGCIVPHAPILLPSVGKEHFARLEQTISSLKKINASLKERNPETVFVIAPQDEQKPRKQFFLHVAPKYTATFAQFGDLITSLSFESDPVLADQIKNKLIDEGFPTIYATDTDLDYSAAVPLVHILDGIRAKLVVLNPAESSSLRKQFECGKVVQRILQESGKRIAVVAAGDVSHRDLAKDAPDTSAAAHFEEEFLHLLRAEKIKKITGFPLAAVHEAQSCGMPAFSLLFGILENMRYEQNILSFESPLGVGHAVAEYTF